MPTPPNAVTFRLHELMAERTPPVSQRELARVSYVSYPTINAIVHNQTTRVDLGTLDKLSDALTKLLKRHVEPGELLAKPRGRRRS